jgi:hypothetical protein
MAVMHLRSARGGETIGRAGVDPVTRVLLYRSSGVGLSR